MLHTNPQASVPAATRSPRLVPCEPLDGTARLPNLIAAAPDLVEALEPIVADFIKSGCGDSIADDIQFRLVDQFSTVTVGQLRRAAAALAKALGK